jgi:CSLREA domain-containing protein
VFTFAITSALPASAADGGAGSFARTQSKLSGAIQSVANPAKPIDPESGFTNGVPSEYDTSSALFSAGLLRETSRGMLQVYIHVDGEINDGLRTALQALGTDIEMESDEQGIVQASVPYGILEALTNVSGVTMVSEPSYGVVNVGGSLTEGDARMYFDDLRSIQGVDGTGVTVGVISDGIAGLQTAVASGDLPATSEVRVGTKLTDTTGGVIATSFRADGDLEAGLGSAPGAEGTAMLEIVHDIAPGAQLRFANFSTSLEFNAAVNYLASVSDVVVDDIGWFGRQTDGSSDVSTNTASALTNASNPIRSYATAVGNGAERHYEALFNAGPDGTSTTGLPGAFHSFVPASPTTDALGTGTQAYNSVRLSAGQSVVVWLVWEDTEGAPTADYDLFLQETTVGAIVSGSTSINALTGSPVEVAAITWGGSGTVELRILVQNYNNASTARNFELRVFPGTTPFSNGTYLNYNTTVGSVGAQGDAGGGVLSVGAVPALGSTIRSYSSRGPTGDGRIKPDVIGVDGVDVSGAGSFTDPFFGTSAAAPHIAGLAALLLEFRPDLQAGEAGDDPSADRATLRGAILNGAIDNGDAGPDNVYGYGKVNGPASATLLFAAPVFDSATDLVLIEGATRTVDGLSFTDLNSTDTHTISVDWGDGGSTPPAPAQAQANAVQGVATAVYDPSVFDVQSQGTIYTVNTDTDTNDGTCDVTHCSLREAITAANANTGTDSIHFNISGAGPHTILIVGSALPVITDGTVIDGYTQSGASPNTTALNQGLDTVIKVAVRSGLSGITGLNIQGGGGSVVRGLAIQRFDKAIRVSNVGGHVIEGNFLGTAFDGLATAGNNTAISVQSGASNTTIGGSGPASFNLISGNEYDGLIVDHATDVTIDNNLIGTDVIGSTAMGNTHIGVYLWEGSNAVVTGNTIASNVDHGMQVETWATANISGNTISENIRDGIFVAEGSTDINIANNAITGNDSGIRIGDATTDRVSILGNSISGNAVLGIDLQPASGAITEPNDALDADVGPSRMQNHPVITSSNGSWVGGTINTEALSIVRVELFTSSACHTSGFGEGQALVVVATVATDASGNATFFIPYAAANSEALTSTATLAFNTSHFSACASAGALPSVDPPLPHYADNGVFTAAATVTDDEGLTDTVTFTVTVSNASPTADAGQSITVVEGAVLTHVGSFTDPGSADTHTANVDWGDTTSTPAVVNQGAATTSATRTFDDDAALTLTFTVTDDDGGIGTDTATVTVTNASPVVTSGANQVVRATVVLNVTLATFTDDGALDTHSATIDWGDGTALATGTVDQGAGTVQGAHAYASEGTYTVTTTVTDDDGGIGNVVTVQVIVQDAPLVALGSDLTVEEGTALLLAFSFIDSASETHDATVVWGDGASSAATVNQSLDTVSASHTYVEQGVFVIQASISDDTGLTGLDSLTVTVTNAPPVVTAASSVSTPDVIATTMTLATFTDAGSSDTHTAMIDWGDGTVEPGTITGGSVSGTHLLVRLGLNPVTVTVTDDDGASTSVVVQVSVFNPPPVPSITAWGMGLSAALLAIVYVWAMRRRSPVQEPRP